MPPTRRISSNGYKVSLLSRWSLREKSDITAASGACRVKDRRSRLRDSGGAFTRCALAHQRVAVLPLVSVWSGDRTRP